MTQSILAEGVKRAQMGHRDAWGDVYRELSPSVYRLCRRVLPTPEDAEDATMEIFLKAQIRLDQYDPERPFKAWLYRVAANHCWDVLRKRRGKSYAGTGDAEVSKLEAKDTDPQQALLDRQSHQQVRRALSKLEDRARLAIALRYYADLSYEEIAETLGVNSSFVGVLLLRARRKLRQLLTEEVTS